MNVAQIQTQMATGKIERAQLLDDAHYRRLLAVLTHEDEAERTNSFKERRRMKEARETTKWWLERMRDKAYREYMAQKGK